MAFDWKKTVATVAPTIATALGGPLAGVAIKIAGEALGLPDGDEDALQAAVASGDPNVLVRLKEAEIDFDTRMRELDVDIERLHQKDRDSARGLATNRGIAPQGLLSIVFVCGFVAILFAIFTDSAVIQGSLMEPAMYLLGILSAGLTQVMNFWFGSSAGSKQKELKLRTNP